MPGRGEVWRNRHSTTYRESHRQYGKGVPGRGAVWRNRQVLPIGKAIDNTERGYPGRGAVWRNHHGTTYSRDGHVANSENSQILPTLTAEMNGKECSDGAGNRRNRKISSRRFSSLVHFFPQLVLEIFLSPIKVTPYWKIHDFLDMA